MIQENTLGFPREIVNREITEKDVVEYVALTAKIKELETQKEDLKRALLVAYPNGGDVGAYKLSIKEESGRRSFKFDDAKASVDADTYANVFAPFIKVGEAIRKLIVTK